MTHARPTRRFQALLVAALIAAPATATTWIVDDNGGPGVDFVDIQSAVDAAVDGDVIEVREGTYAGFTIDGKALIVAAADDALVRVTVFVVIRNVPAGSQTELVGLQIGKPFTVGSGASVEIEACEGPVRIDSCEIDGWRESEYGPCYDDPCGAACNPWPGLAVRCEASAQVVVLGSTLRGGDGYDHDSSTECFEATPGASALVAWQSAVTLLDSTLQGGGSGGFWCGEHCVEGHPGGDGATMTGGSTFLAYRCTFTGGPGGSGGFAGFEGCASCQPWGPQGFGIGTHIGSSGTWKDCVFDGGMPVDADAAETRIAPYCLGTFEACPCENSGHGTAGCEHSFGLGGARLEGVGNASVAADTVTLQVTGLNPSASPTALFFQGTTGSEGILFNDGLLCAGGTIRRMKGKLAQDGAVSFGFGQPGDPLVSAAGNVPPAGATRYYQVWYRNNSASFCTPQRFNMSNGVEIAWAP